MKVKLHGGKNQLAETVFLLFFSLSPLTSIILFFPTFHEFILFDSPPPASQFGCLLRYQLFLMLFEFVNFPLNSTLSVTYTFNMQCLSSFKLFISIVIFL